MNEEDIETLEGIERDLAFISAKASDSGRRWDLDDAVLAIGQIAAALEEVASIMRTKCS